MNGHIVVDRFTRSVAVVVLTLGCIAAALADARPYTESVTIVVFSDRYIVDNIAFDDLNYLEEHITATPLRGVNLLICGPKATRALQAVVHRFRQVPVQMRVPEVDERVCASKAPLMTPVGRRTGPHPYGINDEAVEAYWLEMMP